MAKHVRRDVYPRPEYRFPKAKIGMTYRERIEEQLRADWRAGGVR